VSECREPDCELCRDYINALDNPGPDAYPSYPDPATTPVDEEGWYEMGYVAE